MLTIQCSSDKYRPKCNISTLSSIKLLTVCELVSLYAKNNLAFSEQIHGKFAEVFNFNLQNPNEPFHSLFLYGPTHLIIVRLEGLSISQVFGLLSRQTSDRKHCLNSEI